MPVPGGHQNGVGDGFVENEVPVRPMNLNRAADGQIGQVGQVVGEEALLDPVHAQLKAIAIGAEAIE